MNLGVDQIYVINVAKDKLRKKNMIKFFSDYNITNYTFIDAIDGDDLPSVKDLIFNKTLNLSFIDPVGLLTKNIIACALSHKKTLDTFLSSNYDNCLILEDDVKFSPRFFKYLANNSLDEITQEIKQCEYDVFYWGRKEDFKIGENGEKTSFKHIYKPRLFTSNISAHAYQVTRKSAKHLSDNLLPVNMPWDVYMEYQDLKFYSPKYSFIDQILCEVDHEVYSKVVENIWNANLVEGYQSTTVEKTINVKNKTCTIEPDLPIDYVKFIDINHKRGKLHHWSQIFFKI